MSCLIPVHGSNSMSDARLDDAAIHHSAPDSGPAVLVIIDMFSTFDTEQTAPFFKQARTVARRIAGLRERTAKVGMPTIFANDNYGRWRSDARQIMHDAARSPQGKEIVELLEPNSDDYLVLKPKHSIFYATPLDVLLKYLGTHTLILTGMTATQCVLFSGIEAMIRDYRLFVPLDCVVSQNARERRLAKYLFETRLKADTRAASRLRLPSLRRRAQARAKASRK